MLFKISYPVARHGEKIPVTREVVCDHSPKRHELLYVLQQEAEEAKKSNKWRDLKDVEGCIFALNHLSASELPEVSRECPVTPAICETELGKSIIQIKLVVPTRIPSFLKLPAVSQGFVSKPSFVC